MERWLRQDAASLGRGISAGEIDPLALTETYLEAAEISDIGGRVYAHLTPDRARMEAREAKHRAEINQRRSLLDGVPISWKDLFDTAGITTEAGSKLLEGRVPQKDAEVLDLATSAGLVCLGKTHMSELAFSGLGYNPVMQSPPCVHSHECVSGGSSSGAAASVAFGLAAAGIGSDTGGSVRIPAAWNDLVGLKTTSGRLSLRGVVPLCPCFDTVGPLCRSVEDAGLLLAALEGRAAVNLHGSSLEGARLAVLQTVAMEDVRDGPLTAFQGAVLRLVKAGAQVEKIDIPEVADALELSGVLYATEAYATWGEVIEAAPEKMFDQILARFRGGAKYTGVDYIRGVQTLNTLRKAYTKATAEFDAVLMPTAPILPPRFADIIEDKRLFIGENVLALRNTRIGNLMGLCAITLPTGVPSCGIMLNADAGREEHLLRLAVAVELALRA